MDKLQRRRCYKALLERTSELRSATHFNDGANTIHEVSNLISESNVLAGQGSVAEHVNNATEVVMDAQVIKIGHELLGEIVTKISTTEFSTEEYIVALMKYAFQNNSIVWSSFHKINNTMFSSQQILPCFLGSFKGFLPTASEKVTVTRQRKTMSQAKTVMPENIGKFNETDKGAKKLNWVLQNINMIYVKNNRNPIPYYQLIIDPTDMMQTVDNAFQIAFLTSAGSVAITQDEHQLPTVEPITKTEIKSGTTPIQAVSKLTFKLCQEMIEFYNIKRPLLPRIDDSSSQK